MEEMQNGMPSLSINKKKKKSIFFSSSVVRKKHNRKYPLIWITMTEMRANFL